jgi:uncharacterized protein (DUF849 family)
MPKTIVTAALTGSVHTPSMSPYLPITPEQIADEAIRACTAGAAVAHIHVRNPVDGHPIPDNDLFRIVASRVKSKCDIILCFTTGGGPDQSVADRTKVINALKPELASYNAGSFNFGIFPAADSVKEFKYDWEKNYLLATENTIFPNTFKTLREYTAILAEANTKPELEVYDFGMVYNIDYLVKKGYLKKPLYLQFVMGILGGIQPTSSNLLHLYQTAQEVLGDFVWSVCAAGKNQFPMCTQSLILGGNVRVGMEDNLYLNKGVLAKSNAEQVEKIIRIMKELGQEPATPAEARKILGLKGLDKLGY